MKPKTPLTPMDEEIFALLRAHHDLLDTIVIQLIQVKEQLDGFEQALCKKGKKEKTGHVN